MSRDELTRVIGGAIEPANIDVKHDPRAGNAHRQRTRHHLGACHELGYLTDDQYRARMLRASECETKKELNHLISDLEALPDPRSQRVRRALTPDSVAAKRAGHALLSVSLLAWVVAGSVWIFLGFGQGPQHVHSAMVDGLFWANLVFSLAATVFSAIWWGVWETRMEE